jgi:NAD(P)-dependent dehydrogenase (short-subunit alcohol dehydrogenase family)
MTMRLAGKVAVVAGGASGMGLETVMKFASEGARVVIADFNEQTGAVAADAATQQGFDVSLIKTDVAKESDVEAMCQHAIGTYGRLDILINNAGVGGTIGPLTETTVEDWGYTFDVMAKGVFPGIKHGARIMRRQGDGGSIINTASIAGLSGDGGQLVYSAAVEQAPDHIGVNEVCPSFKVTPLTEAGDPEVIQRVFSKSQPWPDYGRGEHIGGTALFLASEESGFITGESIVVDGGSIADCAGRSRKFPKMSAHNFRYAGVTKGSTGAENHLRKLANNKDRDEHR